METATIDVAAPAGSQLSTRVEVVGKVLAATGWKVDLGSRLHDGQVKPLWMAHDTPNAVTIVAASAGELIRRTWDYEDASDHKKTRLAQAYRLVLGLEMPTHEGGDN